MEPLFLNIFYKGGLFNTSVICFSGYYLRLSKSFCLFFSCLFHLITSKEHLVSCSLANYFLFAIALSLSSLSRLALHRLVFDLDLSRAIFKAGLMFDSDLFDLADMLGLCFYIRIVDIH